MKEYEQANLGACLHCAGTGIRLNDAYVGHLVRTRRNAKHITAAKLATKVGISAQYLGDLERGHRNWRHYLAGRCLMAIDMWEIDSDGDHKQEGGEG